MVDVVTDWAPDPGAILLAGVAAGLYGSAVRRLARRGRSWPVARTAAFAGAITALVVATCSGLATHESASFTAHAGQHALLALVAPLLLALGAPLTLALQAAGRPVQRGLLRLLDAAPLRVLTHPVVVWAAWGVTLVALYTTSLYDASLRVDWLHAGIHLHMLIVGALFCWTAVGLDSGRHRLPHGARLLFVLLAVPFHAVVGLSLLGDAERAGGVGLLWATGELFGLVAAAIVVAQWMGAEERAARRSEAPRAPVFHADLAQARAADADETGSSTPGRRASAGEPVGG